VLRDHGVVIEGNHCQDSRVGVVIEKGSAVVERRNTFTRVDHKVVVAEERYEVKSNDEIRMTNQ